MSKVHDESQMVRSLSKVARVQVADKTITVSKQRIANGEIGIKRWGYIDYFVNHCHWHLIYDNAAGTGADVLGTIKADYRAMKKENKQPKLKDKRR